MLDIDTILQRQAGHAYERRVLVARYRQTPWRHPIAKLMAFHKAHPVADWPWNEIAILGTLLAVVAILGMSQFTTA